MRFTNKKVNKGRGFINNPMSFGTLVGNISSSLQGAVTSKVDQAVDQAKIETAKAILEQSGSINQADKLLKDVTLRIPKSRGRGGGAAVGRDVPLSQLLFKK